MEAKVDGIKKGRPDTYWLIEVKAKSQVVFERRIAEAKAKMERQGFSVSIEFVEPS